MIKQDVEMPVVEPVMKQWNPSMMQRGMQFPQMPQQMPQQIPQQMPQQMPMQGEGMPVMPMQAAQPPYDGMVAPPPNGIRPPPTTIPMNKRRRGTMPFCDNELVVKTDPYPIQQEPDVNVINSQQMAMKQMNMPMQEGRMPGSMNWCDFIDI